MMIKELKSAMTASISEVLETMFYMPLEFDETTPSIRDEWLMAPDLRLCRLSFSGKLNGFFFMAIRESLLIPMAEDFMGEAHENITREYSDGIIKEVLNMVAGHMFSNMDDTAEYHLGIPEVVDDVAEKSILTQGSGDDMVLAESIQGLIACRICLNE